MSFFNSFIVLKVQHKEDQLLKEDNDVEDLEKNNLLIFVSNDINKVKQRMTFIEKNGKFGKPRYEASVLSWKPVKDVNLYFFCKPIDDISPLRDVLNKDINNMYKRVEQSPKTYLVLSFRKAEWERNETIFLKYDFFKSAIVKKL